ncbi:MAG TPA: serine hydrolase domain-containing protein [Gemmatimonadaceae bacterium]|nr:serine hydrolase domain-containing protein [Gemmatimonadaceae bacterium]
MKTRIIIAALMSASAASSLKAQNLAASVDSIIQAELLSKGTTSAQLVITQNGKTLLNRTYGFADVSAQKKADSLTAYRLGSMTKHITASLLLKMVEKGKLSLTDTLGQYLTGLKPEWTGRTIETVLNHTSGIQSDYRNINDVGTERSTDSIIALAARSKGETAASGTKFIYSNTGYMLLAALVEKLYGQSYSSAFQQEIARPLGLKTIGYCTDMEPKGLVAKGYMKPPKDTLRPAPYMHPTMLLAGGLCSNATDIAKWNTALYSGKVVSPKLYTAMTTPRGAAATANVPYGFGMYIRPASTGQTVFLTDGSTPGYANENVWYPAEKLSITLLTNTNGPLNSNTNLTETIGALILGAPKATN